MTRYERIQTGVMVYPIDTERIGEELTQESLKNGELDDNERYDVRHGEGIIRHEDDIYWLDTEGVIITKPISAENGIALDVFKETDKGEGTTSHSLFPSKVVNLVPSKTFDAYILDEGVPLEDFVRRFGARLEDNFWGIVRFLRDVGLVEEEE